MIVYREAKEADDTQLTELVATPMPGDLRLSFRRDPSYLVSCGERGPVRRVLVAAEGERVLAMCSRFLHRYWVAGSVQEIWTVGDFRARPEAAHRSVTGRGWHALRERLEGKPALISVVDQNQTALRLFGKVRKGWPHLQRVANLQTYLLPLAGVVTAPEYGTVSPTSSQVMEFLTRYLVSHLAPLVEENVLAPRETFLALSSGAEITALASLWDRQAHRQWQVAGYSGIYRHLYRAGLLPRPGHQISVATACFAAAQDFDNLRLLFQQLRQRARRQGHDFLVFSQDAGKEPPFPLWWPRLRYPSTLYQLLWDGDEKLPCALGDYPVSWL